MRYELIYNHAIGLLLDGETVALLSLTDMLNLNRNLQILYICEKVSKEHTRPKDFQGNNILTLAANVYSRYLRQRYVFPIFAN